MCGKNTVKINIIVISVLMIKTADLFQNSVLAQTSNTIKISPVVPTDLPPLSNGKTHHDLREAGIFAWQQFIALTWPAKKQDGSLNTRDEPDTSGTLKYGDKGPSGHVV